MADPFTRALSEYLPLVIYCETNMILAWVISLLTLLSMLVIQLERLAALEVMGVNTYVEAQKEFIAAEKVVQECEENITALTQAQSNLCFIQPAGNYRWLISSKEKPGIQIGVAIDAFLIIPVFVQNKPTSVCFVFVINSIQLFPIQLFVKQKTFLSRFRICYVLRSVS